MPPWSTSSSTASGSSTSCSATVRRSYSCTRGRSSAGTPRSSTLARAVLRYRQSVPRGRSWRVEDDVVLFPGLARLGIERPDVVGHSYGGLVARSSPVATASIHGRSPCLNPRPHRPPHRERSPVLEAADTLRSWFPGSATHVLNGASHLLVAEKPTAIAKRLTEFWSATTAGAAWRSRVPRQSAGQPGPETCEIPRTSCDSADTRGTVRRNFPHCWLCSCSPALSDQFGRRPPCICCRRVPGCRTIGNENEAP